MATTSEHTNTIPGSPREITLDRIKLSEKMFCSPDIYSSLEQFCSANKNSLSSFSLKSSFFRSAPSLTHMAPKSNITTPPASPQITKTETKPEQASTSPTLTTPTGDSKTAQHGARLQLPPITMDKPNTQLKRSLDSMTAVSRTTAKKTKRILNQELKVSVSFEEAAEGGTKSVEYESIENCTECSNATSGTTVCDKCVGSKRILRTRRVDVTIPKGVVRGTRKTMKGEGIQSEDQMTSGDLIIEFDVEDHPFYKRDGGNALCTCDISLYQAVLGTKLNIPKLYAKENEKQEITIEPGTQPGDVIRLAHQGFNKANCKKKRGDLIITVSVNVPKSITREQRELFERLAAIDSMMDLSKAFVS